jgi:diphosphomevalonate decarboxylase
MEPRYHAPHHILDTARKQSDSIAWRSPSNLALIKYWGKHGNQLPRNASISITLKEAFTHTSIAYKPREGQGAEGVSLRLNFDGRPAPDFEARMQAFLNSLLPIFPFLRQLDLEVSSYNSFPHSSGIASSASAMSALALCLCSMEDNFFGTLASDDDFLQKASYIARLGSGSACRSVYPWMAAWGRHGDIQGSSDEYAVPTHEDLHPSFKSLRNAILIVSRGRKAVSSSAGHALMEHHPYASVRYVQAQNRMGQLLPALRQGDWDTFGHIVEEEALTLHALMMASKPPYILMHPNSLALIQRIQQFRTDTGSAICFSLDAGPNLHVLYPASEATRVETFIQEQCLPLCEAGEWIADTIGEGPEQEDVA